MSTAPAPLIARVSRRDLARNPFVWRATGGMTLFMAMGVAVMAFALTGRLDVRLAAVAVAFLLLGLLLLRAQPPAIDTWANHAVIAVPYIGSAAIFWAAEGSTGFAIGAAMFISPLAAVRLQNRRHMFVHLAVATVTLVLGGLLGQLSPASFIGIFTTILAVWVLGVSCWEVLQSAEVQGDELERLVRRDPLTGLGNRRLLEETLPEEIERHARAGRPLSALCLDLNGFKALNDTLGHAEGDALLREVGAALSDVARPIDTVVRQGGDEFVLLLGDTPPEHAIRTANAVRAALADLHFEGITTGIGIASFPADATDARTLLHVGDERLLADKAARRSANAGSHPRRRAGDRDLATEQAAILSLAPVEGERRGA
ncbi:MAG: GGDEF domain-containing protein [Solirubrobacteraceae bacterium]|nr:GGDEF domain-containing protein [Solirubrobacteraceae bacterium]